MIHIVTTILLSDYKSHGSGLAPSDSDREREDQLASRFIIIILTILTIIMVIILVIIRVVPDREDQLSSRLEKPNPGFNAIFQVYDRHDHPDYHDHLRYDNTDQLIMFNFFTITLTLDSVPSSSVTGNTFRRLW